jgi:hypothetical protein
LECSIEETDENSQNCESYISERKSKNEQVQSTGWVNAIKTKEENKANKVGWGCSEKEMGDR